MNADDDNSSTFEALDASSEATIGPPAVLLCGFAGEEGRRLQQLLGELGMAEHQVVCCTTTMGTWTIEAALGGDDGGTLLPVGPVPRVALLSGLTDGQVERVLDGYGSTGLPRPIFAVATPANLGFTVIELLEDLMAERQAVEQGSADSS